MAACPFITQSRKWTRMALTVSVCGTGLARSVPCPQLLPGQLTTGVRGGFGSKPPRPPPWVVLGM